MVRHLSHIALCVSFLLAPATASAEMDGMHSGLNGFSLGNGDEFDGGQPYDPLPSGDATYNRIYPERSGLSSTRDPAKDPQGGCRSTMMDAPDAVGRMAHWRLTQCFDANGNLYVLPGSQINLGYY